MKDKLQEDYRAEKKAWFENKKFRNDQGINEVKKIVCVIINSAKTESALFEVSFAKGKGTARLMADKGANTNLLLSETFKTICKELGSITVTNLVTPHKYKGMSGDEWITCK